MDHLSERVRAALSALQAKVARDTKPDPRASAAALPETLQELEKDLAEVQARLDAQRALTQDANDRAMKAIGGGNDYTARRELMGLTKLSEGIEELEADITVLHVLIDAARIAIEEQDGHRDAAKDSPN